MIPVNWNQNDKHKWTGVSIQGMQFTALITHASANTAFSANPLNLALIKLKLRFYKKKSNTMHIIFDDVAMPLVLHSSFYDGNFQQSLQVGTFTANVYVAAAGGINEQLLINFKVKLDGMINVSEPGDVLYFDVQVPNGALSATAGTASSTFYYDIIEGIGLGKSVPQITAESVRASVTSDKYSFGEGVTKAGFMNIDKAGVTSAVQVLANMQLDGDKLNEDDDFFDLLSRRNGMFEDLAQSNARNQSFMLFDMARANYSEMPTRLKDAGLSVTFNSSNVNAGMNWYTCSRMVNDDAVLAYYKEKFPGQLEQNVNLPVQ